ncbi:uncharacterized protein B0I36DRAFT_331884 [Microdochium trichocladiopsis]|uniref:Ig-like domain-containing protein n=1 Tax=Microdochium trichocladiopsis TaxID=1682393 RepID=A0A9P9BPM4_9PEZI|nr:uncharacterized protein B0I36DRAFT_331884 [Microdochium trichocladiopsis]KAH7024701.1 hypothetical protein B0I36DRAFT_331884 [Microdochium trichocladiopsis]
MKLCTLAIALVGSPFISANPLPGPQPAPLVATESNHETRHESPGQVTTLLHKRKACTLVRPAPGTSSIPCRARPGTVYPIVATLSVGSSATILCKTLGSQYQGTSVWEFVNPPSGQDCYISAFHVRNGCDDSVRWC